MPQAPPAEESFMKSLYLRLRRFVASGEDDSGGDANIDPDEFGGRANTERSRARRAGGR